MEEDQRECRWMEESIRTHLDSTASRHCLGSIGGSSFPDEVFYKRLSDYLKTLSNEDRDRELSALEQCVQREEAERRTAWEKIADDTLKYAYHVGVITAQQMIVGLVMTADFTLRTSLPSAKFKFIKDNLHILDYKGVRSVFKALIDKQMLNVPQEMSAAQRNMLLAVEDILLHILDRNTNSLPPLFAEIEINVLTGKLSHVLVFPRVMAKAAEMDVSFRSLAELSSVSGRSFLYPIPAHPAFPVTGSLWRIDAGTGLIYHRLHLPYRIDMYIPQFYMILMLLKQPRGKDHLQVIMRQGSGQTSKFALDNVLLVQTMEAMVYAERRDEPSRYVWENILQTLLYCICHGWVTISRFISILTASVEVTPYRRARNELMWMLLQVVTFYPKDIGHSEWTCIMKLHTLLFDGNETQSLTSTSPLPLVCALSSACLYIILRDFVHSSPGHRDIVLSPSLQGQIDYITGQADTADEDGMLAVVVNAYDSSTQQHKRLMQLLLSRMRPSDTSLKIGNRPARSSYTALSEHLLESLGVRGQMNLLHLCMADIRDHSTEVLPSPALIETTARLLCMLDMDLGERESVGKGGLRSLVKAILFTFNNIVQGLSNQKLLDHGHILMELLSYRCQPSTLSNKDRSSLIAGIYNCLTLPQVLSHQQMCPAFENLALRTWSWLPLAESNKLMLALVSNPDRGHGRRQKVPYTSSFMFTPTEYAVYSPEVSRSAFISWMRTYKIIGCELSSEFISHIRDLYDWPSCTVAWLGPVAPLPQWTGHQLFSPREQTVLGALEEAVRRDYAAMCGVHDQNLRGYFTDLFQQHISDPQPSHKWATLLCAYFRISSIPEDQKPREETILDILDVMPPLALTAYSSTLVEFLIYHIISHGNKLDLLGEGFSCTLQKMLLERHMVTLDRFLFAAAHKPQSDESSSAALTLVLVVCRLPLFREIVAQFSSLPRLHSTDYIRKVLELNQKYFPCRVPSSLPVHPVLPVYYSTPLLRSLPSIDILIERALQLPLQPDDTRPKELLDTLSPLYKYHPYPLTFCYSLLFTLYEKIGHSDLAQQVCRCVVKSDPLPFTHEFMTGESSPHHMASVLVNNLIAAIDIVGNPPPFVAHDWRSSELPPGGQSLYAIACELMACRLPPRQMGDALIRLLYLTKLEQPMVHLNAVSLILTALPHKYSEFFLDEILGAYESEEMEDLSLEEIVFESYDTLALNRRATRPNVILHLAQALWHHARMPMLVSFLDEFRRIMEEENKVDTEKKLFYTLHILIPLLQRIADFKEVALMNKCFSTVVVIYKVLLLVSSKEPLQREDMIADLLYLFKYMFLGDFKREEIEDLIGRMQPTLRQKLKFIVSGERRTERKEEGEEREHEDLDRKNSLLSKE